MSRKSQKHFLNSHGTCRRCGESISPEDECGYEGGLCPVCYQKIKYNDWLPTHSRPHMSGAAAQIRADTLYNGPYLEFDSE